jgi:alanine racemase
VDYLAVAFADEGVELRKAGISLPIMVMNPEVSSFEKLVCYKLEPELYSMPVFNSFYQYIISQEMQNFPVHLKIDTGMHRLGFEWQDMELLGSLVQNNSVLKIQSVFSHLAGSDDPGLDHFTQQQFESFLKCSEMLQQKTGYPFIRHIANSSAIHRHKNMQLDMVRLGIGLYGVDSIPFMQQRLMNVTTLKTTISQIKNIRAGETVGYSRKGLVQKNAVIATVRIGYADGYPRILGNGQGCMLLNGKQVPVIGNICMDMTMLDITGVDAKEGDEVIVFGKDLPVSDVASRAQTIAYEILTGVSQRVKRVYYEE